MTRITLTALEATHPLGFLAAIGLLRVLVEDCGVDARLGFPDGIAVLEIRAFHEAETSSLDGPAAVDALIVCLTDHLATRAEADELAFDDVKDSLEGWRQTLSRIRDADGMGSDSASSRAARFVGSFASDLITSRSGEATKPTAFYMTAGQQLFVRDLRKLVTSLRAASLPTRGRKGVEVAPTLPGELREALFGPWTYRDDTHPLGWDPWGERLYAYQGVAPSDDKRGKSTRAAIWLAFEALALFPVFAVAGSWQASLSTTGFVGPAKNLRFVWPVWSPFAALGAVRVLLASAEVARFGPGAKASERRRLSARGVSMVCRATRADLGTKGYAILRPPELIPVGST